MSAQGFRKARLLALATHLLRFAPALVLLAAAGCDVGIAPGFTLNDQADSSVPPLGDGGVTGLPCAVAQLLQTRCLRCHSSPPANGATMPLLSLADLKTASYADPNLDFAHRSVVRIMAGTMPPGGGMSSTEILVLQAWVNSGEPAGECAPPDLGGVPPPDLAQPPADGPPPPAGLPCDVAAVYQTRCLSCHGHPLANGAPQPLVTRDELLIKSLANVNQDYAQRSVVRMQAGTMPPGGGATQQDITTIQTWISGGEVAGACAPPDGGIADAGPPADMARPRIDGGPPGNGLPCDIAQLLQTCASCHGNPPANGAPMTLMTYAELTQPSINDPRVDFAHRSLARMQANTMPPGGGAAQADINALQNWINGGEMQGSCADGGIVMDPLNARVPCTSGTTWNNVEDAKMRPGEACISCHARSKEAPAYDIGGTLYPTGHEQDDCNADAPSIAGATIVITDAKGVVLTLTPNSVGNFFHESGGGAIALPYKAKVLQNGKTRTMGAAQMSGDCNDCHTQIGKNGAPGRVTIPIP